MTEEKPKAHLHTLSVFDCPRIIVTQEEGSTTLYLDGITIHVYGHSPYNDCPQIVPMSEKQYQSERFSGIIVEARAKRIMEEDGEFNKLLNPQQS